MNSTIEPLDREELERRLRAAIDAWPYGATRFYRLIASGRCPASFMRRYARSTYLSAKLFCASIAEMVETAPDPEARLILLENLLEEEGAVLRRDRGLVVRPDQSHPALALRFVKACDAEGDEGGDPLHATGEGRAMLAAGRWLEAVAYLLVGQELRFAETSGAFFRALRDNGFAERDLAFFAVHETADAAHGRQALDLVIDRAVTRGQQDAAIAAAGAGARAWFEAHGGGARLAESVAA
ncbi:MAG: iron-containing redox enzyme family protein [Sphingosinicella sp.]|uniref:iron-containing redox enzyme family protein n=1 Tax=Sphingosinicella sp. TaxID=1917971 RepID=UPI0040383565